MLLLTVSIVVGDCLLAARCLCGLALPDAIDLGFLIHGPVARRSTPWGWFRCKIVWPPHPGLASSSFFFTSGLLSITGQMRYSNPPLVLGAFWEMGDRESLGEWFTVRSCPQVQGVLRVATGWDGVSA